MRYFRPLELGFAGLLLLTIAGKMVAATPRYRGDQPLLAATAATMLHEQKFMTRMNPRPAGIVVEGWKGSCRLSVREYPPGGTYRATIAAQARAIGPLHFAYRGELLERPPKAEPLAAEFLRRIKQRFGFEQAREPVVAVAASPGCELAALSWSRLASLPR